MSNYNDLMKKYNDFVKTHQPGMMFNLKYGADSIELFKLFTDLRCDYVKNYRNLYDKMTNNIVKEGCTPATFFKKHYDKLVEFCAGSKKEAAILYPYFDKLNQFPYPKGYERRIIRCKTLFNPISAVRDILFAAYNQQIYNTTLDKYLLNELSEELIEYKYHSHQEYLGVGDLIAAHLDAGDKTVKNALITIITSDNMNHHLTTNMIRGILKSDDNELHQLLANLLLAARLQEGIRQAICENMDCGTIASFKTLFKVIDENNLLRYSAIRRGVATWIGVLDPDHLVRSSNKTFKLMKEVIEDKNKAYDLIDSDDAMNILVGLWGLGFYEVYDAIKMLNTIIDSGTLQQKRVASYYNLSLYYDEFRITYANKVIESNGLNIELAAGIIDSYMRNYYKEVFDAVLATNKYKISSPREINLKIWFPNEDIARNHLNILTNLLKQMDHKKYEFNPYIFPWHYATITRSDILIRILTIAKGLNDEKLLDEYTDKINEIDATGMQRRIAAYILFTGKLSEIRKDALIVSLGNKETYTRLACFDIIKETSLTLEDYDKICNLLHYKGAEIRIKLIDLIQNQNKDGLLRSLKLLLNAKNVEMRLAGLDILNNLIKANKHINQDIINEGKDIVQTYTKITKREQIIIDEIFGNNQINDESNLYTKSDTITPSPLNYQAKLYPIFNITTSKLDELFTKLDQLIDSHKNVEVQYPGGDVELLGNINNLPTTLTDDIKKQYPITSLWTSFYENEIKTKENLIAMYLSLMPYKITSGYLDNHAEDKVYNQDIYKLATAIFGKSLVDFDHSTYKSYQKAKYVYERLNIPISLFENILALLIKIYLDKSTLFHIGSLTVIALCQNPPKHKAVINVKGYQGNKNLFITPTCSPIINIAASFLINNFSSLDEFKQRFNILFHYNQIYLQDFNNPNYLDYHYNFQFIIQALDFITASYHGLISKQQMFYYLFEADKLTNRIPNLFTIYKCERFPTSKKLVSKYGILEDEELKNYLLKQANEVSDEIVRVECKRGDTPTKYSYVATCIPVIYGAKHLVSLLLALGKDKLVRSSYYGESRIINLSYLISICHPSASDTIESFTNLVNEAGISEKRLVEIAMYAPQWIDLIETYLKYTGLKMGAYYFMAHMNDQYSKNDDKFSIIARFTHLEKEELFNGAFDIDWFYEAYQSLGEDHFALLYDACKYISDGSRHTRARKYADAALNKISTSELEKQIKDKRNKDLLMSYPLIPLSDKDDLLHRYEFIQAFRKESKQFGAARRNSEALACDMALRNLASRAGYKDVTRLILVMETSIAEKLNPYFKWMTLNNDTNSIDACIQISNDGKVKTIIRKKDKILSSIPATFKKDPYILALKEACLKLRDQYRRSVNMFEDSMIEKEAYTIEELIMLMNNPIVKTIIENLVFINDDSNTFGLINQDHFALIDDKNTIHDMDKGSLIRVAHPYDFYQNKCWSSWQQFFFNKQQQDDSKQPFRQVFRELYIKLNEELEQNHSRMFAGYQIQTNKTAAILKNRRWLVDYENGLEKVFYKDGIVVTMYALADWFSPSDIEPPTIEEVSFTNRKSFEDIKVKDVDNIVYSEAMRDVDLAVSVAHAGNVDPEATHSTIEMRKVIIQYNLKLFKIDNVRIEDNHALIKGYHGEYSVHLGSGVIHMIGVHQINVLPVHSQHRGRIFLPFLDEDPKTAEIISKILLFASDTKIKDPYILEQMH